MSSCVSDSFAEIYRRKRNEYYSLGSADDVISAGLHLTDLNLFDNTSDLLITGMQQEQAVENAFAKVSISV